MPQSKPALLFVHGAYHKSHPTWTGPRTSLELNEYETHAVDLPCVGVRSDPPRDHFADVVVVREKLALLVSDGKKVLMVPHSYGGVPTSSAVEGFEDSVVGIVFVDALVIPVGKSTIEVTAAGNKAPQDWRRKIDEDYLDYIPAWARDAFYNDVSMEDAQPWLDALRPWAAAVTRSKVTYAAWKHVPCMYMYIDCKDSVVVSEQTKRDMLEPAMRESKLPWVIKELNASHTPMLRHEEELVRWIREAEAEWTQGKP